MTDKALDFILLVFCSGSPHALVPHGIPHGISSHP